jgi:hypothetical protein
MKSNLLAICLSGCALAAVAADTAPDSCVRISPRDTRYLELSNGQPYVPIGLNMVGPDAKSSDEAGGLRCMETWFQKLSTNGGNYVRIWISSGFFDVEHERSGVYDEAQAKRIEAVLVLAKKYGIRVKLCLEHFRSLDPQSKQAWAQKLLHRADRGGPATDMNDFFTNERSRAQFKAKLAWLTQRFGNRPEVFGWELWNEVNAVSAKAEAYMPWTQTMLAELHRLTPQNLAVQSLGSYDRTSSRELYRRHSLMPGNDLAQVHRYLDGGASWEICHGPVDVLAADAVRELLAFQPGRPVLLAESGAVENNHSGPFKLYAKDKEGLILHDVLFAPFFAGAAGPGHCWHWNQYVERNNLWWQIGRFANAVKDLDPPAEHFQPSMLAHPRLRVYQLHGRHTLLLWCRDGQNTWQAELAQGQQPETLTGQTLDLAAALQGAKVATVKIYDPWRDRWSDGVWNNGQLTLPAFSRSIVVRIEKR